MNTTTHTTKLTPEEAYEQLQAALAAKFGARAVFAHRK